MSQPPTNESIQEEIRREHEELRQRLREVHDSLAKEEEARDKVVGVLRSLAEQIEEHFADEELDEQGLFDQVVAQAPRLATRADALVAEHGEMRQAAQELVHLASNDDGGQWRQRLRAKFHDFGAQLMHHETKENELLLEAYGDDIGDKD